ncbi:MAG: CoB--CoM heterodisulfide reductase iron-sulfur subunit A family protein [Elusimicrobia bacterium]|nr:CoB--CoM heterodisulfide reductase iron-sulfur subunit A family protein [Elusimicrobiota bacterium]
MNESDSNHGKKVGAALVVGGGIGGMQAALDFAAAGIKAYLVDRSPCIGGAMAQLDKTFPTNDCSMCTMAPRLVEISRHKDIEIIPLAEVEKVSGRVGDFSVSLRQRPRFVNEKCTGCGACLSACPLGKLKPSDDPKKPQPIPDEYNEGLSTRPAIYIPYPQAVPNFAVVDPERCLHLKTGKCKLCLKACQAGAIDFTQKEREIIVKVGAVVAAPGYKLIDPKVKPDYGYGTYKNVVTALEFERLLSASGPHLGKVLRPSDKTEPKRIAFIQCVGSRDNERDYCSAVCCMYATKEALLAKEHLSPDLQCDIYFMDLRAFSKGFEEYYNRAKSHGVNYIRCRVPKLSEDPATRNISLSFLTEDETKRQAEYDLVVLSAGLKPNPSSAALKGTLGLEFDEHGFCVTKPFAPVESGREGIFVAGVFTEPKDIPETVIQASGAVAKAMEILAPAKGELLAKKDYPAEIPVAGQEPRVGVFICHCGTNIASVVAVPEVVAYAKSLPNVEHAENVLYACANDSQEKIKKTIVEKGLNRVIVAACTPRTHEPLFRNTIREAGLNPYLFEMANIRDQCSWVHMSEPGPATRKAKDLVRMALAKSRLLEPLQKKQVPIQKGVLVIGGGLAGMTAALTLARQGFPVRLVERDPELGGMMRRSHFLLEPEADPQKHLRRLIEDVKAEKNITVFTGTKIAAIEGCVGNFKSRLAVVGKPEVSVLHGAVIVATGAREHRPEEYLYGKNPSVLTQLELEERLSAGGWNAQPPRMVVMIQCVGSRDEKRPNCSRVCCGEAVKNALKIKELSPETSVYVLFRDVRTYGFKEAYYTEARRQGVVFGRYDETRKPSVAEEGGRLRVTVWEPVARAEVVIPADLVVLSAATVPHPENKDLAQMLKVPLDPNGFFLEAHMKLRPVDFATEGVFLCGAAHFPKTPDETIAQALAAAARVAAMLANDTMALEANISQVIDENCDGCAYCVDPCPYKAVTLLEYMREGAIKKIVEVNESLCKGCGVCQATCPKKGISVRGFMLNQISAMAEAALSPAPLEPAAEPKREEVQTL